MSLAEKVTALCRFVSRVIDHCVPFFDVLKVSKKFEWTDKCEQAFQVLKEHMGQPPLLSKLIEGERLFLYLTISKEAVNATLIRAEEKVQQSIYYVSILNLEEPYVVIRKNNNSQKKKLAYIQNQIRRNDHKYEFLITTTFTQNKYFKQNEMAKPKKAVIHGVTEKTRKL